jgi:hypothetical protein
MGVFNDATHPPRVKAGYGTAKKARNTLRRLKGVKKETARQIARTMYYRAKYHKFQTEGMKEAMKIYRTYLRQTRSKSA